MIRITRRERRSARRLRVQAFLLVAGLFLGAAVVQSAEPVSQKLTPKLLDLLRQEMISINQASQQILVALVIGDDEHVATLAQQIHDSFIMNQSMTEADEAALLAAVPEDFVQQDEAFHEIAAALAGAARAGNRSQQQAHFSQMIEACTACHATYATDRFPHFAK